VFEEAEKPTFGELPEDLVKDLLNQSLALAGGLRKNLADLKEHVETVRSELEPIRVDREIISTTVPTSCGVDGSYLVERLLSTDLAAFAALAIEGITPPSEKRHWPAPKHYARVASIPHHESTQQVTRGLMMCQELLLGHQAPHDVVMLDWGFRTPAIFLNNATSNFKKCPSQEFKADLREHLPGALDAYAEVTNGRRSEKIYVGAPKYSTLNELTSRLKHATSFDDRTLATLVLKPGEFLGPYPIEASDDLADFHITVPLELAAGSPDVEKFRDQALEGARTACVLYYKPRPYLPAMRLEVAKRHSSDAHLATLLRAIEFQCSAPGVFEPFPLYLADRMVKHLPGAFPAFLQAVTHDMATSYEGDTGEVFLAMHSYRSEGGR
jgi:hypothetical protein